MGSPRWHDETLEREASTSEREASTSEREAHNILDIEASTSEREAALFHAPGQGNEQCAHADVLGRCKGLSIARIDLFMQLAHVACFQFTALTNLVSGFDD